MATSKVGHPASRNHNTLAWLDDGRSCTPNAAALSLARDFQFHGRTAFHQKQLRAARISIAPCGWATEGRPASQARSCGRHSQTSPASLFNTFFSRPPRAHTEARAHSESSPYVLTLRGCQGRMGLESVLWSHRCCRS